MKSFFKPILASLIVASSSVFAQDFMVISESAKGNLLVDIESITISRNETDKLLYVAGMFKFVFNKEESDSFILTVSGKACNIGSGYIFHLEQDAPNWNLINKYKWSTKGKHSYDEAAMGLCSIYKQKFPLVVI